ncbi:MAG: CDP-alcohol phosphatidyltransferase family protein [Thermomicrobiales bacterium]
MANLITAGRILLLFVAVALLYSDTYLLIFLSGILIAVVILADGLDGWVARRRKSTSELGAVLDIAGDRVVENVLWVVFVTFTSFLSGSCWWSSPARSSSTSSAPRC